jgi:pimeloyl-ACP methyl ester carboxylesterase
LTDFLTIHGVRLEIQWSGAATTGPVIVLLHEGLGSVAIWKDFPDRLAEATNLRVFAYSRQGYGQSDPITGPREPDYMHVEAEAVLPAVLAAAGIDRPILFGHSDGASIALIYAATHPVTALVLEAPHVFVEPLTVESIAKAKTIYETTDLGAKLGRYHRDADQVFWGWNAIWLDPRFLAWNIEDRQGQRRRDRPARGLRPQPAPGSAGRSDRTDDRFRQNRDGSARRNGITPRPIGIVFAT